MSEQNNVLNLVIRHLLPNLAAQGLRVAGVETHISEGTMVLNVSRKRPAEPMKTTPNAKKARSYVGEDAKAQECLICCENACKIRLIHKETKNGGENKCNHPICWECLKKSIVNQRPKPSEKHVRPKCPFCNNEICSMVGLEDKKVTHLPSFEALSQKHILRAAIKHKLQLRYRADDEHMIRAWTICSDKEVGPNFTRDSNGKLMLNPLRSMRKLQCNSSKGCNSFSHLPRFCRLYALRNGPSQAKVCKAVLEKLKEMGHKVDSNVPALYGGTKPEAKVVDLL